MGKERKRLVLVASEPFANPSAFLERKESGLRYIFVPGDTREEQASELDWSPDFSTGSFVFWLFF